MGKLVRFDVELRKSEEVKYDINLKAEGISKSEYIKLIEFIGNLEWETGAGGTNG